MYKADKKKLAEASEKKEKVETTEPKEVLRPIPYRMENIEKTGCEKRDNIRKKFAIMF